MAAWGWAARTTNVLGLDRRREARKAVVGRGGKADAERGAALLNLAARDRPASLRVDERIGSWARGGREWRGGANGCVGARRL